jgi:uncharacterized protein (TIGR00255 family)
MPIQSMTGFGRAASGEDGFDYVVEIRSVNHRYLDVRVRLPRSLQESEGFIKSSLSQRVVRGRVDVTVTALGGDDAGPKSIQVDHKLAEAVVAAHTELADTLSIPMSLDTRSVASWPGVLQVIEAELDPDRQIQLLSPAVLGAVESLVEMRTLEGGRLVEVLARHLDRIEALRQVFVEVAPAQAAQYRERLERRIRDLVAGADGEINDNRVMHEVGVFAERTDIVEELERLRCHLEQARTLLASDGADGVGRKLDFLCQEMLRETNTVGSKAQSAALTETVVDLKSELERLREQVQNVE